MCLKIRIDINCDLGESYGEFKVGNDEKIMPYITSANVACGFHAGDPVTMMQTISLAKKHKVAVGAHPGFPDLMGFGRREMQLTDIEVKSYIIYQVGALQGFAKTVNLALQHVKPHGALYNMAVKNEKLSKAIVEAIKAMDTKPIVFAPPNSVLAKVAIKHGLRVAFEFFADRAYNPDGSLLSRKYSNAIIQEPKKVMERTVKAVEDGTVLAANGEIVNLGKVHTVCVHGDTPNAVELAKILKKGLVKKGIDVKPAGSFV
jgi:UPF0271 protein